MSRNTGRQNNRRTKKPQTKEAIKHGEEVLVQALKEKIGAPVKCVGNVWYVYREGVWKETKRDKFRPLAQSVCDVQARTHKKTIALLNHLEDISQCEGEFWSAYRFHNDGSVSLNCHNVVLKIDQASITSLSHSEKYNFTAKLATDYDPNARANLFHRLLKKSLPDAKDRIALQRFAGWVLYPNCRYGIYLLCFGNTLTGKSTLTEAISRVLENDEDDLLVTALTLHQICDSRARANYKLPSTMLNLATEIDGTQVAASAVFKQIVCGEPFVTDQKYRDLRKGVMNGKMIFCTNVLPRFPNGSEADQRRLRVIKFSVTHKKDTALPEQLANERSGILLWMLRGLQVFVKTKEIPCGSIASREAEEEFEARNDSVGMFWKKCCVATPGARETQEQIYRAYLQHCRNYDVSSKKKKVFFKEFKQGTGLEKTRPWETGKRPYCIDGMRLKDVYRRQK